ncbi:hypothetical protein ABIC08_008743 [Bradyrhizobium sp. RT9b]
MLSRLASTRIVTLSEGDVTHLHVGLKGTMNALFLKDLADKTRRGLRGRVEDGKSGGGLCFGYDVVKQFAPNGEPIRRDRTINEAEATVVRRVFADYIAVKSSRAIAFELNKEGVPGPQGAEWGPSTIHGNPKRSVGILNNELYVGRLVWNRLRYLKDPDTGKRVSRLNPESEWVIQQVPEMRIIDQEVWDAVKARQQSLAYETSVCEAGRRFMHIGKLGRLADRERVGASKLDEEQVVLSEVVTKRRLGERAVSQPVRERMLGVGPPLSGFFCL